MKSRWDENEARAAIERWGEAGEDLALRVYSARLIGGESKLVLHGGGNVSIKRPYKTIFGEQVEAIHVKGSGWDLAGLEPAGLPALDLPYLRRLGQLDHLSDEQMTKELRAHLFDASAPNPSIETLVHAVLEHRYVDHSHADAVLTLTNQPDGEKLIRDALGERVAIIPYVFPGFDLSKAMALTMQQRPEVDGVVLLFHGLFTFGEDARTAYERHIELVNACERFLTERTAGKTFRMGYRTKRVPKDLIAMAGPILRGLLARKTQDEDRPYAAPILEWRSADPILEFVNSAEAAGLAGTGPITTDHLIRTGRVPLFIADPVWEDVEALRRQLLESIDAFRKEYRGYIEQHAARGQEAALETDPSPRVLLLPGAGALCFGPTKNDAVIAADITEHTLAIKTTAHHSGGYVALSPNHLFDMEFRGLQLRKLGHRSPRLLEHRVVVVSGGAGAIGSAVGRVCARAGAHVILTDVNQERLDEVVKSIEDESGAGIAAAVVMDVTNEADVRVGFEQICRIYGGVDVLVPNAGIAHVAAVEDLDVSDFKRVLDVNLVGYLLFIREGIRILKAQEIGGHIVINASKNVFGPGKDFGAYSASKAAGHQLGKVAAIELADHGIRVNMINADAVFGDKQTPSGLWEHVGPQRARSRHLKLEELPEYYRQRNLLKARIYGHHVGNAVVFFASSQTPTTGATLPVDGGVVEAFPR